MKNSKRILLALLAFFLLTAADCGDETTINQTTPTGPDSVTIAPATNCAPTKVAGEIRITDESQPSGVIDRVTGALFDGTGASVCNWNISRDGNASASDTCRNLTLAGAYSFRGFIHLNNGQEPTSVEGGCTLTNAAFGAVAGSIFITESFEWLAWDRGMTYEEALWPLEVAD